MFRISRALIFCAAIAVVAPVFGQGHAPAGIEAKIQPKTGAWETLKAVNTASTPNDARNFGVAFPIGNGRLGAKVFGATASETIPLNDTTLWSGPGPEHFESPAHHDALLATRAALESGDYVKADQLVRGMEGPNTQFYEPRGGYEVDIMWAGGALQSATIRSLAGASPKVEVMGKPVDPKSDSRIHIVVAGK